MAGLNKNTNGLLIKVAWGVFAIIFIILICLAVLGGESITRKIDPSSMGKPAETNPGFVIIKKLPAVGWKTIVLGGLVSPSQIAVLENHKPLPNGKCNLAVVEEGIDGCYYASAENLSFASTDKTSPKTNGKSYEMTWRWKPSLFLIFSVAIILLILTKRLGKINSTLADMLNQCEQKILSWPYGAWVFTGFLISYWFFFFMPVFLNSIGTFQQSAYIPIAGARIGMDQNEIVNVMVKPFFNGQTDFLVRGPYPPLLTVLYAPFTLMDPATSYATITIINLGIFLFLTLFLPWKIQGKLNPLVFLFIVSGLYSYGFHFEVERGQFNLLTIFFVFSAVWSFHYYPKFRLLSYLLFSIAIQFKVFPILFIICFVDDWRSWNTNIKRFIGLGVFNFALLFVLGYRNFFMFLENISGFAVRKFGGFSGHSVSPFINSLIGQLPENYTYLTNHSAIIGYSIIFGIIICLGIIIFLTYKKNLRGFSPLLLLACTAAVQMIPAVSNDYTLAVLVAPVAMVVLELESWPKKGFMPLFLVFIITLAYSSTLYSIYTSKALIMACDWFFINPWMQVVLTNNFTPLFIILIACTILAFYQSPQKPSAEINLDKADLLKEIQGNSSM